MVAVAALVFLWRGERMKSLNREGIERMAARLPLAELAVSEFTIEIISRAARTERGATVLRVLSGGAFGADMRTAILYRGCVRVTYGVDLAGFAPGDGRVRVTDDEIELRVPRPRVIGLPRVLNTGACASEVLDVLSSRPLSRPGTWFSDPVTHDLQALLRAEYQTQAARWAERYGVEALVRQRTGGVLAAWLAPVAGGRRITVVFEGDGQ
jgi:hypothetical protein